MSTGKITLTIDNVEVAVDEGTTILEAALDNDIYIPHLCYNRDLAPAGTVYSMLVRGLKGFGTFCANMGR